MKEDHAIERMTAEERAMLYSGFKAMLTIAPTPWHATNGYVYSRDDRRLNRQCPPEEADRLVALVNAARLL